MWVPCQGDNIADDTAILVGAGGEVITTDLRLIQPGTVQNLRTAETPALHTAQVEADFIIRLGEAIRHNPRILH
jgi:hypothetical protein